MQILGIKQYGIHKYQEGTNENGIQLNYIGPQYYEILEKLRKEDPMAYNRLQQAAAQSETSEISRPWIDADGNMRRSTNVGAGFVSGTDPVGSLYVEGVATAPIFNWVGKAAQYGLARAGNNWARAKILSREMQNISTPEINTVNQTVMASIWANPDKYRGKIPDKVLDFIESRKAIAKGLEDSRNFIQSKAVKDSKEINQRIADRLGLQRQAEYELEQKPVIYHNKFKQKDYNLKGVNPDNVGGYYDPMKKTVNLRGRYSNQTGAESTAFHEDLHAQGYGPSEVNDWKIQYLVDKDKVGRMAQRDRDYYLSSTELPVHTAELGHAWGIKPGQPYPGDKIFDELLYNNGISGAAYYLKRGTPKDKRRFWRVLNGTMFGLSVPIIINNKNNNDRN